MAGYGIDALEALSPGRLPIGETDCLKAPHRLLRAVSREIRPLSFSIQTQVLGIAVAVPIRRPHPPNPAPPVASVLPWHYAEAFG